MIKEYIDYFKHNPNNLWFKRKLYGWGWTPVKWQGWLVVYIYLLLVIKIFNNINRLTGSTNVLTIRDMIIKILLPLGITTSILIFICYKKGESPRWQWGVPKNDKDRDAN
jgi:hypothetical protein